MKKFLLKNSKWVYYILGIISALVILSSLFFMTQYRFVRVNYKVDEITNEKIYDSGALLNGGDQKWMFLFIDELANEEFQDPEFAETKKHTGNMVISLESKVRLAERMLEADRQNRNRVKRFAGKGKVNPAWEKLNEVVKQRDEEWKSLKKDLAVNKRILDKLDKDKAFLQEVSGLLG